MLSLLTVSIMVCAILLLASFIMAVEKGKWWFVTSFVLLLIFFLLFKLIVSGEMLPTPLYKITPYI